MFKKIALGAIGLCLASAGWAQQIRFREISLPTSASAPTDVAQPLQGAVALFTYLEGNKIGSVLLDVVEEYPIPTPNSGPMSLTYVGAAIPSGPAAFEFWFTESRANRIGRLRYLPSGDSIPEIPSVTFLPEISIPTPNSAPRGIAHGLNRPGQAGVAWFTEFEGNKIGRASADGAVVEFAIPTPGSGPWGITFNLTTDQVWFTEFRANKIGRLDPVTGVITEFSIPTSNSGPVEIAYSAGHLWFTESNAGKIGRISPNGMITEYALPDPTSAPWGITADASGGAWFTERAAGRIGRIKPDGTFREFDLPTRSSGPEGIDFSPSPSFAFSPPRLALAEATANRIAIAEADHLVIVGAGDAGAWDTRIDPANPESYLLNLKASPVRAFPGPCVFSFCAQEFLQLPPRGTTGFFTSHVPRTTFQGIGTWFLSAAGFADPAVAGFDLPTVKARVFNRGDPLQSADLPVTRYSTIAALDPSVLSFPGAEKGASGERSNLVLANLPRDPGFFPPPSSMNVLVEVFSSAGDLQGSGVFALDTATTFLADIVGRLGISELHGGQIRVGKMSGTGLLWGILATIQNDGLTVSLGVNP
jgi:virginiamycin B lyase